MTRLPPWGNPELVHQHEYPDRDAARRDFFGQSVEADRERRKRLVWKIDRNLQEDGARPMIYHDRAATCWYPQVKGLTILVNSIYNGARDEDVWARQIARNSTAQ